MTTKPAKVAKKSRAQLERQVLELESQLAHRYAFAAVELHKAGTGPRMGSGVLLQLSAIGGKEIINPVMIKDGLSDATIAAIRADLDRSYNLAVLHKPADTKGKP